MQSYAYACSSNISVLYNIIAGHKRCRRADFNEQELWPVVDFYFADGAIELLNLDSAIFFINSYDLKQRPVRPAKPFTDYRELNDHL